MLTKQDLEAIGKLIDKRIDKVEEKVGDLGERLEDKISDLYSSIFSLRAENSEDHRGIKRRLTEVKEVLDTFVKHFDRYLQDARGRISRIEDHIKLPPIS